MMVRNWLAMLLLMVVQTAWAQDEKVWSVQAGIGGISMLENRYDKGNHFVSEDEGNAFYLSADYWLSRRLAVSGGLTWEQQGLFSDYSDGIGLKKVNMMGVQAGAKYYFFPTKWIVQPHVGASVYTNIFNLGHHRGEQQVAVRQAYPGTHGVLTYDVSCPAVSLSPQVGVDIHLLSTLSLCIDYDYRFGLWGSNTAEFRFTDGPLTGQIVGIDERNHRGVISVGLKLDFPTTPVSETARNNLWMLVYSWISSKARY